MSQNKLEKSDLIKKRYIYNVRKKSGWEVPEIGHVFVDSIVFKKNRYIVHFWGWWGWRGKKSGHFLWTS